MNTVVRAPFASRTWLATLHVIGDFYVGVVTFSIIVTLLSTAAGLAITFVLALPVAWLLFGASRALARMERARAAAFLGVRVDDPHRPVDGSWLARLRARATEGATWREIGYHLVLLLTGAVGGSLVIAAWAGPLALIALPFVTPHVSDHAAHFWLFTLSGASVWVAAAIGVGGLFVAPWVARGWARLDESMVRRLLGPSAAERLAARVDTLATTRAMAVDAAETERRRIERDLHDGAQQRLVALAMDLGMARAKLDADPTAARALLDEAHDEAKRAIVELRDLARGIHPVALTDRGLPGAIPGLASRAPIPVDVHVDVAERPAAAIEGIAYFVVSEALTNVAKHSGASRAAVSIVRRGEQLHIEVRDNGIGGAAIVNGAGLRGLTERVAAIDGTLTVESPRGGPTVVRAALPCTVEVRR